MIRVAGDGDREDVYLKWTEQTDDDNRRNASEPLIIYSRIGLYSFRPLPPPVRLEKVYCFLGYNKTFWVLKFGVDQIPYFSPHPRSEFDIYRRLHENAVFLTRKTNDFDQSKAWLVGNVVDVLN